MSRIFIFDSMLGDIAKWMRFLGFKTEYYKEINDNELLKITKKKGATLITRDLELSKRDRSVYYLKSKNLKSSLKELIEEFSLKDEISPFRLCPVCGRELLKVEKEYAKFFIPGYVYFNEEEFYFCSECFKFYWKGTKFDNIKRFIEKL